MEERKKLREEEEAKRREEVEREERRLAQEREMLQRQYELETRKEKVKKKDAASWRELGVFPSGCFTLCVSPQEQTEAVLHAESLQTSGGEQTEIWENQSSSLF